MSEAEKKRELLCCVVKDYAQRDMILEGFIELGITGATVVEAQGMAQVLAQDVPIFAGLSSFFPKGTQDSHMILSVMDSSNVEAAASLIQDVCGKFDAPRGGYFIYSARNQSMGFFQGEFLNTILGLIAVGLLAFLGAALFEVGRLNPVVRALVASGIAFFFMGILLGPRAIGLLDSKIVSDLDLVVDLGVGWVGLLYGLQFRYRDVKKFYLSGYLGVMTEAVITLSVIWVGIWLVYQTGSIENGWFLIVLLAAIGSTTSTSTGTASVQHEKPKGPLTKTIRFFESLDAIPAVLVIGMVLCCATTIENKSGTVSSGCMCFLVAVMLGNVMGILFSLLTLYRYNTSQLVVIVLGLCVFSSGAAHYLRLSPLLVNFIVGLVVANTSRKQRLLFRSLVRLEKPLYLVLLIIAGSMWVLPSGNLLILVPVFLVLRIVGKLVGGAIGTRVARISAGGSFGVGPGILAHDGMALALAISIKQILPGVIGDVVLTVTASSILINNIIGPWALRKMLIEQREIS